MGNFIDDAVEIEHFDFILRGAAEREQLLCDVRGASRSDARSARSSVRTTGEPGEDEPPGDDDVQIGPVGKGQRRTKYYVRDVEVNLVAERVQYYGKDGKLITESLVDYTKNAVQSNYASLHDFLSRWTNADRKQAIVEELENEGILLEALSEEVGRDYDAFDLVAHVAFGQKPLTRRERAENVKKRNYFAKYEGKARAVLEALLDKYADEGLTNLEDPNVLKVQPFDNYGTPVEIVKAFGGKAKYEQAVKELEQDLYQVA